jgi:integrase/recombinase XerD
MNTIGVSAYVIPIVTLGRDKPFTPYIYSNSELESFFHAADQYPQSTRSPLKEFTVPVLFRLIYSCGLRPQEARKLKRSDVDFDSKTIFISDSKRHKDRIIPVDVSIMDICKEYDIVANVMFPSRMYFFQFSCNNKPCSNTWVDNVFRKCWQITGIRGFHNEQTPRVYDFRHNYASRRIMQWLDEDKDLNVLIPYLSAYMGHVYLSDTFYYVHLIPDLIVNTPSIEWSKMADFIPEV